MLEHSIGNLSLPRIRKESLFKYIINNNVSKHVNQYSINTVVYKEQVNTTNPPAASNTRFSVCLYFRENFRNYVNLANYSYKPAHYQISRIVPLPHGKYIGTSFPPMSYPLPTILWSNPITESVKKHSRRDKERPIWSSSMTSTLSNLELSLA